MAEPARKKEVEVVKTPEEDRWLVSLTADQIEKAIRDAGGSGDNAAVSLTADQIEKAIRDAGGSGDNAAVSLTADQIEKAIRDAGGSGGNAAVTVVQDLAVLNRACAANPALRAEVVQATDFLRDGIRGQLGDGNITRLWKSSFGGKVIIATAVVTATAVIGVLIYEGVAYFTGRSGLIVRRTSVE